MDGFWRFVGLNVTNLYESWFCLKLASLKMGHVSVVEFEVLGFKVEATDRLEVRGFSVKVHDLRTGKKLVQLGRP